MQLLKGEQLLLDETYLPDADNRVYVDIADIVTSSLALVMPSGDAVSTDQNSIYAAFTVKVDGESLAEFTAVRSGVERFSDTPANFLTANWLTWQPQVKEVLRDQPEWLTYYPASGNCACYAKFYYTDGTDSEIKVCDMSQCVSINTRFSKLWSLDTSGKERYGIIDVYVKDAQGLRLTYAQRYLLRSQEALDEVYLCENSLGGLDTFRFYGDRRLAPEIGYTTLLFDNTYTAGDPDLSRKWSQNTGMLTDRECEWCWELFRSSAVFHLYRGTILPIVLDSSSIERSAVSVLSSFSFDYRYASDSGLLNMTRSESLPDVVEIPGPGGDIFFLAPRLNEFPSAVFSDDLIIPVQSPYEENWYKLSVGELRSTLLSSVETVYGTMWHVHENLQLLNLLSSDESGNLLFNGQIVGSGIVGEHDHHGETIRPEKIVVGTVEITCVDGRLHVSSTVTSDGDFVAYGDDEGGTAGGGLDVARLWEELAAADASKVIDVSHIPGSVVLQDELTEILDDYPLTTEMNTALGKKANKDWVEEELTKYVTIAGNQDITGVKTFVNGIKIGSISLSVVDGRLHVSSTVTSDGDFVAYGDEEGGTGSGGLDVARLWEELKAEDVSKVIDVSHIPGSVVLQDELVEILDDYPLTTEMNTALGKKANKDWVEEELTKYVTIAGNQDITGVKTFVNGIKIGSISLSVVDGRLHVSSTVTSDGDFVAFGDEEGSTGSGGLDVARLWEELRAIDSSKVIDVSHIPNITKAKISDFPTKWAWADISGKPSTFTPSAHSHAISDVTGLQNALDSKWVWSESQIKAVKVNSAINADYADQLSTARKINDTSFNGAYEITTAKWGMARLVSIMDYAKGNTGTATSVDGSESFSLLLPQSIKVKTLDVDGVTLSVVDGRLHISATATSAGDFVAYGDDEGGAGVLDIDKLWEELRAADSSKVINITHIPAIPTSKITGLDNALSGYVSSVTTSGAGNAVTGYAKSGNTLTLKKDLTFLTSVSLATISDLNSSWDALLKVAPTKYVTRWPTASEVGALTQTAADGRYLRLSGGTMSGTPETILTINAEKSNNYVYFSCNNTRKASVGFYNGIAGISTETTGSPRIGIQESTGSPVYSPDLGVTCYPILHSGNIGSYALTPSNYASTLDSRYVNASGDTMTGKLTVDGTSTGNALDLVSESATETYLRVYMGASYKAAIGYHTIHGAYLYNRFTAAYLGLRDNGLAYRDGYVMWDAGNDGSGSGLDADLLDGVHLTSLASAHHYLASSSITTGYYKILINSTAPWMLYFRIRLYQSYNYYDIDISGYNYHSAETNYSWCSPKAKLVSSNVDSVKVYFGHDSANKLWVAVPALQYTGLAIYDVVNGYSETSKFNAFTISYVSSLSGTTDSTQTCYRGASINDNVASATKLQTSRTLWGRPFNGEGNVSGSMTGVGSITASGNITTTNGLFRINVTNIDADRGLDAYYSNKRLFCGFGNSGNYGIYTEATGWAMSIHGTHVAITQYSGHNVGIGTTSPAYKLDVAGEIRAISGITIGSTDDYGWYISTGTRISAGVDVARGVNVGSLLVSSAWADYTKVPTNGIYSKGDIITGGRLFIPSSEGNDKYYIRIE